MKVSQISTEVLDLENQRRSLLAEAGLREGSVALLRQRHDVLVNGILEVLAGLGELVQDIYLLTRGEEFSALLQDVLDVLNLGPVLLEQLVAREKQEAPHGGALRGVRAHDFIDRHHPWDRVVEDPSLHLTKGREQRQGHVTE